MKTARGRAAAIELLVLDVDGVLTDGRVLFSAEGDELKSFHVHDGYGIRKVQDAGVRVAVISGRSSEAVVRRMQELGVTEVYQGCRDKLVELGRLQQKFGLRDEQIAFIGDDEPDIDAMSGVGFAIAVANAHPSVLAMAHWRTTLPGGAGAVREVCDLILEVINLRKQ